MLFYWYDDIPKCVLNLETIEELILERFQLYCSTVNLQCDTKEFEDLDRIAHIFLCIIAIDFPYFEDLFISGELKIFKERYKGKSFSEINRELLRVLQLLDNFLQSEDYKKLKSKHSLQLSILKSITETILSKGSHVFKSSHSERCRKYKMTMPFTFPLKLVAKRDVEVRNGKVSLSCGKWYQILEIIFEYLLKIEMALMMECDELKSMVYEMEDDRIRQIIKRFINFLNGSVIIQRRSINAAEVDLESQYFPPCMASLHQVLRQTHRLSYESRYQYTLFLKDIGLSVDENVLFWENEYTKPHEGSTCIHEWEEKEKRYKYQIQHLYGLIGVQQPKNSHSCDKFIGNLQSKMNGGCPFQHLTAEDLREALPISIKELPDVEDIFKFKSCNEPQKACTSYLKCQKKVLRRQSRDFCDNNIVYVVSPLQYYNMAKNF